MPPCFGFRDLSIFVGGVFGPENRSGIHRAASTVLDRRWSDRVRASFVDRADPGHADLRARWLADHPKAKLYIDFGDFGFVRLTPLSALMNGCFGRAARLTAQDLGDYGQDP